MRALITTREGVGTVHTASVWAGDAHNDGAWHHLALRRGGGKLTLFVDGRAISTTDVPGSVSRNSPFGVHVGQRMDSRAFLTGAIDDVRVWNRALGDSELNAAARVGARKGSATPDTVLWLPMDQVG